MRRSGLSRGIRGAPVVGICILAASLCGVAAASDIPSFSWTGSYAPRLSEYGLFMDAQRQIPADGVISYDIISPLFTDYAFKRRFIRLPPGTAMRYRSDGAFDLPVGSVVIKTFLYPFDLRHPEAGHRLIETRLLVHTPQSGWKGAAYVWNADQTDAFLAVAGKRLPVEWVHSDGRQRRTRYSVPNMNQCRYCHAGYGSSRPLALTARQLNRNTTDDHGASANQLRRWSQLGLLTDLPAPEQIPQAAAWNDPDSGSLSERVRSYLDTNCAHCHNPKGLASLKRMDLRYHQTDPWQRGIGMRSTGGHAEESGLKKVIVPGAPDRSAVYLRMKSTDFTFMMPQLGRTVPHDEGLQLVADWIRSLSPTTDADSKTRP